MFLAESTARDGSATFGTWRAAASSNKAIWTGGLQAQKRHHKGLRGHYEGAVIDAPWTLHLPKLIVWLCLTPLSALLHDHRCMHHLHIKVRA